MPVIEAPSEGEAQAAQLVKEGTAYAVASQDADSFLFGAPRVVRNLSLIGKKKMRSKLAFETYKPEIVDLDETLHSLGISQEQLIALGMLVGTDFNPGIPNIGPKKALKLVSEYAKDLDGLFSHVAWESQSTVAWREVFSLFSNMPVIPHAQLHWKQPDFDAVTAILVKKHEFSAERLSSSLLNLQAEQHKASQRGLGEFL